MQNDSRIEFGDCRDIMRRWARKGVCAHMCVTSPPYWGLRDYGVEGQLGREKTPEKFVKNLVEVFRCVRDILSVDGTLWLNIGDSYATGTTTTRKSGNHILGRSTEGAQNAVPRNGTPEGCKTKDLIGIPWMLAFALRDDGWFLRQEIIWDKRNPMPESVTDRCVKSHEHVFLLAKSPRYYFNHKRIQEPATKRDPGNKVHKYVEEYEKNSDNRLRTKAGLKNIKAKDFRNKRSVWSLANAPFKGSHCAVYPPKLIEPCILAGSRQGGIVLDPFMGSGTTAMVAENLGRKYLGCELNPEYAPMQQERLDSWMRGK